MAATTCPKCQGTGHLPHFTHSDGGRCWACTDKVDTSYTRNLPAPDAPGAASARRRARKAQA